MKLLILNTFDMLGGAAIATYRLHQGLRSIGIDSSMLVQCKISDDSSVLDPQTRFNKLLAQARPHLDGLTVKLYRNREKQTFSAAMVPDSLLSRIQEINPDVIHLFWVTAGFLRLETLKKLNKPIVWTLHDMWPFTGGCHYDGECGKYRHSCGACPILHSSKKRDLSNRVWARKFRSWKNIDITVVATSNWLAECARSSSLFGDYRIEVMPNGIDTTRYKPLNKSAARHAYNLPQDKKLILFSSFGGVSDKRKGYQYLLPALQKLAHKGCGGSIELVILGTSVPVIPINIGIKVHYIKFLQDEVSQVLLYSAADILVLPSLQENLSNTVMEALACGTPVISFNIGGMPDLIQHESNGYLAEPFSSDGLADGIVWVLENENRRQLLSQHAQDHVINHFGLLRVAEWYHTLYRDILE